MQQIRDMGQLPLLGATGEPGKPEEVPEAQAKTLWDSGHVFNRADRRRAMKAHMSRAERLQVFGVPTARKAVR